jgi:hypothetical protein
MLVAFTFRAKPGKEKAFEALLRNPEAAKRVARLMCATRNTLFLGEGRLVRILEFPEGAKPVPLTEIAARDAGVRDFLAKLGPLVENGFDVERPETLEAFNKHVLVPLAFDVRP